ncbi:MAG: bifunctional diguanylate cyclase/phosphodiesterase [Pseudomonadota bacterium]
MFETAAYGKETELNLSERFRTLAFWTGLLGLLVNAVVVAMFVATEQFTPLVFWEVLTYICVLSTITISAHRNYRVRTVLFVGLLTLFAVYWISAFYEAVHGQTVPFDLPLVLFIPLLIVLILDYRLQFALMPVQASCVYLYVCEFVTIRLDETWSQADHQAFSLMLAVVSGFSFMGLGVVAWARARADGRLRNLIIEKEQLAATDGLTGLLNRRAFMETLRRNWTEVSTIGIAFVDLDHFKPLNDQFGHAVGDQILQTVAQRIQELPTVSAAARLGGDEFAVLFNSEADGQIIDHLIDYLHAKITADIRGEAGMISIDASIGYAEGETLNLTLSGLLKSADTAMRRAKSGRLGWAVFNPRIDGAALANSKLELELKTAIKDGQIKAAIQPIADAKSRKIVAYELLARWTDSAFERDPSPKDFIPIAEKLGLLNEMLWVTLDEALAHLQLDTLRLAINVSPAQLIATDFLDTLVSVLDRHEVSPNCITIEITEEVAFRNVDRNIAILQQARDMGIEIALDDFGTGYSSLSMLDTLPLDKLKIDQSFVRKSDKSEQSKSILLAAIRLARQLGLTSCVEGIETQEFAARVAVLGADHIQGYWLGRPELVRDAKNALKMVS